MSKELKKQLWKTIQEQGTVMVGLSKDGLHSEPMQAQVDKNNENSLWFYTFKDNRVAEGGKSMLQFVGKKHEIFSCMGGQLTEEKDSAKIDKFWSKDIEAWYKDGKSDKNLLMMRFDLDDAEIWTRDPSLAAKLKMATGASISANEAGDHIRV